ncbi:DUF3256 family protein [uncultured Bacteroides sp.]|uniref:DUF3256 family protein n=1 Tax=uncultured Bacteroides sp. TaxID=162156 RepID=UPI002AAB6D0C|nr:DUF3256 family protein [uncultured Bacteroides sp.]
MKKIILLCFLISCVISLKAQDAKSVFINIPDSLSPLLTKVNREDFSDFLESKMKAVVKNKMEKMSEMKVLTKDYLFLQTTSQSSFQLKLLQLNDTTKIICVVNTACAPVCDSRVLFYTTNWKEIPSKDYIEMPGIERFFLAPDSTQVEAYNNARAPLNIYLLKADLSKDNNELTFTFTTPEYLDGSEAKALEPFLKKVLVYVWKDGRFVVKD